MKRILLLLLALMTSFSLLSCKTDDEKPDDAGTYELPEITGMKVVDAIVKVNGNVNLNPVNVRTNEYRPGLVLGYAGYNVGDKVALNSKIDLLVSEKPNNAYSLDRRVTYVSEIAPLTGPGATSYDNLKEAGIYGTDLGIPVKTKDGMILLFGDSYSGRGMSGFWYSNFITKINDDNYNDGLNMETIVNERGQAAPFFQGKHQPNVPNKPNNEVTKIPTGGITIGNTTYVFYMSIRYWGVPGEWFVSYNGVVKSEDLLNWTEVPEIRFTENDAPNFGQVYPYKDKNSDYIYIYGIPGGRNGSCVVARTTEKDFLNQEKYEYLTAKDTWTKGSEGLRKLKNNPYAITPPLVSELSVMYNSYLKKYLMSYLRNGKIVLMQSDTPYGPFADPIAITDNSKFSGIYGGFIHDDLVSDDGQSIYMSVSSWKAYNTFWVKVVLK